MILPGWPQRILPNDSLGSHPGRPPQNGFFSVSFEVSINDSASEISAVDAAKISGVEAMAASEVSGPAEGPPQAVIDKQSIVINNILFKI